MQTNGSQDEWTVQRLLDWTRAYFQRTEIDSPRLSAELLLARAMQCERIQLYTRSDACPDEQTRTVFRELVSQAAEHKPIAYLLGSKEFFSLTFQVSPDVLIPRPETEILVERAIALSKCHGGDGPVRVLDLCTGSGCVAVSVAKHVANAQVTATDISSAALKIAQANAERHQVADRVRLLEGDLYDALPLGERFDLILCNPPYIAVGQAESLPANVRDHEPHIALLAGEDGLDVIRRVIDGAVQRLATAGHLLVEVAFDQAGAVLDLFDGAEWSEKRTHRDHGGHQRVVHATRAADRQSQVA